MLPIKAKYDDLELSVAYVSFHLTVYLYNLQLQVIAAFYHSE